MHVFGIVAVLALMSLSDGARGATVGDLAPQPSVSGEIIDRALAIVAGDVIMLSDVMAAQEFGFVKPEGGNDPIRQVLSALIDRALVLAEVERYAPPEPDAGAIDRGLDEIKRGFASSGAFEAALARAGLGEAHIRERLRQDLRIQAYFDERFASSGRETLVRNWIAGLRRRADIIQLYK
jgi:hypothetical protein